MIAMGEIAPAYKRSCIIIQKKKKEKLSLADFFQRCMYGISVEL
jgi:hypothetical protein